MTCHLFPRLLLFSLLPRPPSPHLLPLSRQSIMKIARHLERIMVAPELVVVCLKVQRDK